MTTRITGLYSNLDVDALVEAGASYYQNKVNKAEQQKQILEWKQSQYQSIESDVETFYNKYLDVTSDSSLTKASNWNILKFTSSDDSAVTVTGSTSAALSNYTVSVSQLASAATTTLKVSDYTASGNSLSINGTSISLSSLSSSASDAVNGASLASAINSALGSSATVTASYSAISGGVVLTSSSTGSSSTFNVTSNGGNATTYTGKNLHATITNSDGTYTIDDTNNKTTSNSATLDGVTFNFNETTQSTSYLTSSSIESVLGTSNITKIATSGTSTTYTLTNGSTVTLDSSTGKITGADGTTNSTSSISIGDGRTITINNDGSATTTSNNAISITGSEDASDLSDLINSFVTDYNSLITEIQSKSAETYDSDYLPLTDSEKSSMTDSEISSWNTKAETGLLHNDDYLNSLASAMKDTMSTFLKSAGINIDSSSTGITAVDDYSTKNGTYTVDTDTLKSALENSTTFSKIKSLFTDGASSVTQYTTTNVSTDGVLARLKVALNNQVMTSDSVFSTLCGTNNHVATKTTCELYKEIEDEDTLLTNYKSALSDKEDALYSKYSTLETKLSQLDSSSSLFSSSSS